MILQKLVSMSLFYLAPDTWKLPQSGVSISDITNSSAVVTWRTIVDLPSDIQQYYKYIIEYRLQEASEWTIFNTVDHQPDIDDRQRHVLSDLHYATWYEVQVRSVRRVRGQTDEMGIIDNAVMTTKCTGRPTLSLIVVVSGQAVSDSKTE